MIFKKWKLKLNQPDVFFPLIIIIAGIFLIIITPIGANNDEETYMARIFEMSLGHIMPNSFLGEGRNYPVALITDSYRQDVNLWPIDVPTWMEQAKVKINWQNRDFDSLINYKTRAVYFPTLFILQAPIMRFLGPRLDIPVVYIYYVIRFSYLVLYLVLVYFSLRIIPFGKWLLGVVVVAPTCLITAASISPDPIIFGVCFLFIAWILFLFKNSEIFITRRQLIITCILILALGTLKPNYIFLLFLLFALPFKGFLRKRDFFILIIASFISIGVSLGWSYMASQVVFNQLDLATDTIPQFKTLIQNPVFFFKAMALTISVNFTTYLTQFIGVAGYSYWRFPLIVYIFYPIAILLSYFLEEKRTQTSKLRVVFLLTGIINFLVIFVLFFIANTPLNSPTIIGITGRYFNPFLLLFLIPLMFVKPVNVIKHIFIAVITLISLLSLITLFFDYHVMCGGFWIAGQTCKLPYYKNWGPETFLTENLAKGDALNQNIIADCHTISKVELWPMVNDLTENDELILNLRNGSGDLLSTTSFSPVGLPVNKWYGIDIPDVSGMKGSAITIEIIPSEGDDLSKFALGVFPTNEYTKGELFIKNGATGKSSTADNDLIFKYQCEKP